MIDFSFEASAQYLKYSSRVWQRFYDSLTFMLILLAIGLIYIFIIQRNSFSTLELILFIVLFIFIAIIKAIPGIYRARNYITKFTYEENVIKIDRLHYNTLTIYTGKIHDFEIAKKASIWGGKYKTLYYLSIKSLKDNSVIKQYEELDWNEKVMDNLITILKESGNPLTP